MQRERGRRRRGQHLDHLQDLCWRQGTIEAKGGNLPPKTDGMGGGGGGRIALVFDKAAQRKQPPVTVRFSTAGGQGNGPGEPGTLFLSDADILKTIEAETPPPQPPKEKAPHDTK